MLSALCWLPPWNFFVLNHLLLWYLWLSLIETNYILFHRDQVPFLLLIFLDTILMLILIYLQVILSTAYHFRCWLPNIWCVAYLYWCRLYFLCFAFLFFHFIDLKASECIHVCTSLVLLSVAKLQGESLFPPTKYQTS